MTVDRKQLRIEAMSEQIKDLTNHKDSLVLEIDRLKRELTALHSQAKDEIGIVENQLADANAAMVERDATIRELREEIRRISAESCDYRNRLTRELGLVVQLVSVAENLSLMR